MTDEKRIQDIEARLETATPGPWEWSADDFAFVTKNRCTIATAAVGKNAALIANAPVDLRWLLTECRNANERLREAVNEHCSCGGMGPGDRQACGACLVWHSAGGRP